MYMKKLTRPVVCNMDEPIVRTESGLLRGRIVEDTYIFRGIKYAEAKRFHMPEQVKPWDGVKKATVFGPVCCEISTRIAFDEGVIPHYYLPQDENCQYLNIWTQSPDKNAGKPVMVWIHGGGYSAGSSVEQFAYDGENLSKFGDVVVVSLNHRLNALGFLNLSKYGECYKYSGNAGMADIVMALEWVRDNIEAFGGDPDNVTVFGQSGGGGKITTLLQSPAADGLFHKAMMMSGVFQVTSDVTVEASQRIADLTLHHLGIPGEEIDQIERIPYYELARAAHRATEEWQKESGKGFMWAPVFDDDYYRGHPMCGGFREETKHIPIVLGSVLGEFTNNYNVVLAEGSKNDWSNELKDRLLKEKYGDSADAVVSAFIKAYPEKNTVDALYIDKFMRKGNIDFARIRAQSGCADIYSFLFSLECPINSGTVPWHGAELPFLFHNAEYIESSYIPGVTERLQDMMSGACVAFAQTGDPNHSGMPEWMKISPDTDTVMIFDRESRVCAAHDTELMELLPDIPFGPGFFKISEYDLGGGPVDPLD